MFYIHMCIDMYVFLRQSFFNFTNELLHTPILFHIRWPVNEAEKTWIFITSQNGATHDNLIEKITCCPIIWFIRKTKANPNAYLISFRDKRVVSLLVEWKNYHNLNIRFNDNDFFYSRISTCMAIETYVVELVRKKVEKENYQFDIGSVNSIQVKA